MQYLLLLGLYSWIVLGLVIGGLAPPMLAPRRGRAIALGLLGALGGGLLATLLGFGGLGSFDVRSMVTAGLGALSLVLLGRG